MKQEKIIVEMQKEIDKSNKYTIIMCYKGGTYLRQVEGITLKEALNVWGQNLDIDEVQGLGKRGLELLKVEIKEEIPTLIDGLENVWYVDFLLYNSYMYAHIIKTG